MQFILFVWCLYGSVFQSEPGLVDIGEYELAYEMKGEGEHTILLEGGARGGLADWNPVFEELSESYRVIRYARVGNGKSTQIKRHFTSQDYADHANLLLERLHISEPVVIVAHSYGGSVGRDFAATYSERVKGLLFLDPSSEHDVDVMRAIDLKRANEEIARIKLADMANGMSNNYLDFWSKRPLPDYPQIPDIPVTVIASVRRHEHAGNLFFSDRGRELWGKHWEEWAGAFPQGRAVLTDQSGHFIQADQPELVITELRQLIDKL
ncbi:alpha/beta fold hydrolase [Roseivirga sp. BDSF3-8]|uniref:alpha/beta fold hydrolase n=1 Tax=Roseivirga sp. BDSF3-8 TaxID=3241598 RepID=UPI003531B286